jgi:hypothetical protein
MIWAACLLAAVALLMLAAKVFLSYSTPYTKAPQGAYARPYAHATGNSRIDNPNQPCAVYVFPGRIGTGETVYVGSAIDPDVRQERHETDWWWPLVTRERREEWFPTVPEAEARERQLIAELLPIGNVRDKPKRVIRA